MASVAREKSTYYPAPRHVVFSRSVRLPNAAYRVRTTALLTRSRLASAMAMTRAAGQSRSHKSHSHSLNAAMLQHSRAPGNTGHLLQPHRGKTPIKAGGGGGGGQFVLPPPFHLLALWPKQQHSGLCVQRGPLPISSQIQAPGARNTSAWCSLRCLPHKPQVKSGDI